MSWQRVKLSNFLKAGESRFKPNDKTIEHLKRVDKIDFSGQIYLSNSPSKTDMILVKKGDLLISGINVGKGAIAVYEGQEDITATIHYSSYEFDKKQIDIDFLKLFLKSPEFLDAIKEQVPGGIKTEIKPKHLLPLEVMIPKLKEQRQIVSKFLNFNFKQTQLSTELNQQLALVKELRQAYLREAMQGKLVAQSLLDEPAEMLLEKIKAEKEKLLAEGKIKRDKPLPPIKGEEIPFDVPGNWVWCRLGEIFKFIDYRGKTPIKTDKGIRLITAKNIRMGYINNDPVEFISENLYTKWMTRGFPQKGDLLFVTEGHTMGFVAKVNLDFDFALAQRTINLHPYIKCYSNFTFFLIMSPQFQNLIKVRVTGSAAMGIQSAKLKEIPIPLPPLAEQERIVAKLEKLMKFCDGLEQNIKQSIEQAEMLLETALREALQPSEVEQGSFATAEK